MYGRKSNMYYKILFFIFSCQMAWEVNSMALKGPILTRYDPCGLGLLHFDKISQNNWKGTLQFGLYAYLNEAEVVISFENETIVSAIPNTINVIAKRANKQELVVHTRQPIPRNYEFYVALTYFNPNASDVPVVTTLTMNNVTLCDKLIKASQTITSFNLTQGHGGQQYHVCGRRAIDHEELISVRTTARPGDWPWHVAIFMREGNTTRYECGGNIVSSTAIVTAGHCVFKNGAKLDVSKVVVVAGTSDHMDIHHIGRQVLNTDDVILHPAYSSDHSTSDLAIIRVSGLKYTEYVQPICVWGPVYKKESLIGQEGTVVGFGSTELDVQSDVLRSTYTMVQNDTTCTKFSPNVYGKLLNEFTFCAGYGPMSSINPRNGDSGGGLAFPMIQTDHRISWLLRGVLSKCGVSPGQKQCDPRFYVVYTDVAPHYGWIYHHAGLEYRSNILKP